MPLSDDLDLDEVTARLEEAAAEAPTILHSGKFIFTPTGICRVCGCSDKQGCPGGCIWAEPNLCSRCALGRALPRQRRAGAR